MIRPSALLIGAPLVLVLAGCPSPETNGSTGSTTSTGSAGSTTSTTSSGAGGSGGAGGGGGGTCAPPFTAPPASEPSDCTENRELGNMPDGTVLHKKCSPYHVAGTASAHGHLVIEAGVHVQLAGDAHFDVADNNPSLPAHVDANGTAADPIVFEPDPASSAFGHVHIGSTAPGPGNSSLHYVELRSGASNQATLGPGDAVLFVGGAAPVLLDHVNILGSKHFGLGLLDAVPFDPASNHVFIDGTPDGPAFVSRTGSMATLPTLEVGCDPGPGILMADGLVQQDMTWATQPVPLLFRGASLHVLPTSQPTTLTIAAPNTLLFGAMSNVAVGGNQGVPANLVADGAVTFDAIDPANGWKGFYIVTTADHGTILRGGTIAHAGTTQAFGAHGKSVFASVILGMSLASWPTIEDETIRDANPAPPGATNESACILVSPSGPAVGTEPMYETLNTFANCGGADVAHTD